MISMDKKYKTRNGQEVKIYSVDGNACDHIHGAIKQRDGNWRIHLWYKDGATWSNGDSALDLIEVKERKKIELWANVYNDGSTVLHKTREKADRNRSSNFCFACVKVTIECEEGEGL